MNYNQYKQLFEEILNHPNPASPYDDEMHLNYTKLNRTRMKRWDKQLVLDNKLTACLKHVSKPLHWIIITEPWCGDAAHIIPFLIKMTEENEFISYDIQLRDSSPSLIENYLTNGSKSIPKLIVRDSKANDLFVWGKRHQEQDKEPGRWHHLKKYHVTARHALLPCQWQISVHARAGWWK